MSNSALSTDLVIAQTRKWVKTVVIGEHFCPFASQVFDAQSIRYHVVASQQLEACLQALIAESQKLDETQTIETTLLVYPQGFAEFEDYLGLLELAEDLLVVQGYEGIYQLASFHPHYQFADADKDDPANYTNRSPYPMLHLLRESSLEKAIADHPDSKLIPERNQHHARALGQHKLAELLENCMNIDCDQ